jgi:phage terminase large subunit GpA-like protein
MTVAEWADKYRVLSAGASSEAGRYRCARVPYQREIMESFTEETVRETVLCIASQIGKALDIATPIPTTGGMVKMGDLKQGDTVFDERGKPCRVTFATEIMHGRDCFEVKFSDNSKLTADADHLWTVDDERDTRKPKRITATTAQLNAMGVVWGGNRNRFAVPVCAPVGHEHKELPVDPYVLGVWLGDGHSYSTNVTIHEADMEIMENVRARGYTADVIERTDTGVLTVRMGHDRPAHICGRGHDLRSTGKTNAGHCAECGRLSALASLHGMPRADGIRQELRSLGIRLRDLGLKGNGMEKHIPAEYLAGSIEQRLELLRGLMDTDGTCDKQGSASFTATSKPLFDGFCQLICSLGYKASAKTKRPFCRYKERKVYGSMAYIVNIRAYSETPIFNLKRKRDRQVSMAGGRASETMRRRIISITPVASVPVRCIQVDSPSRLYLAGRDHIPTHNTELMNNLIGYMIHMEPSAILVKYPTLDAAKGFSKEKLEPMVNDNPVLSERIRGSRERDSGNTILQKTFAGGFIRIAGANSPSGLRRASCRVVLQDEIDSDPISAGKEGDPCTLADKRAANFSNAVKVKMSTPTIKGQSKIWKLLEDSDFRTWRAVCPHCSQAQELTWSGVRWDKDAEEKALPETAWYQGTCGCRWSDIDRQRAIMRGSWKARQPFKGRRGYHLSGLYRLMGHKPQFTSMLHEFAVEFLEAKAGGPERMKAWINTFLAEPSEEEFEKIDEKAIVARAEDYDPETLLPAGVLRIEAAADVQEDRIEFEFIGYGEGEETWGLGYHVIHGDTQADKVWEELDLALTKTFKHPCGKVMGAETTFIDSGARQDRVLQFTGPRRSRGIFACKGYNSAGKQIPVMQRKPSINNKRKVHQWIVGVTAAKTVLYSRLMLPVPGAGSMHFPKGFGYDARYFRQLTSERRMVRYSHGKPYYIYEADGRRNEPLDIRVYALAAHRRVNFDAVKLREEMKVAATEIVSEKLDGNITNLPAPAKERVRPDWRASMEPALIGSVKESVKINGTLPSYVPISQRVNGGGGTSMFRQG